MPAAAKAMIPRPRVASGYRPLAGRATYRSAATPAQPILSRLALRAAAFIASARRRAISWATRAPWWADRWARGHDPATT